MDDLKRPMIKPLPPAPVHLPDASFRRVLCGSVEKALPQRPLPAMPAGSFDSMTGRAKSMLLPRRPVGSQPADRHQSKTSAATIRDASVEAVVVLKDVLGGQSLGSQKTTSIDGESIAHILRHASVDLSSDGSFYSVDGIELRDLSHDSTDVEALTSFDSFVAENTRSVSPITTYTNSLSSRNSSPKQREKLWKRRSTLSDNKRFILPLKLSKSNGLTDVQPVLDHLARTSQVQAYVPQRPAPRQTEEMKKLKQMFGRKDNRKEEDDLKNKVNCLIQERRGRIRQTSEGQQREAVREGLLPSAPSMAFSYSSQEDITVIEKPDDSAEPMGTFSDEQIRNRINAPMQAEDLVDRTVYGGMVRKRDGQLSAALSSTSLSSHPYSPQCVGLEPADKPVSPDRSMATSGPGTSRFHTSKPSAGHASHKEYKQASLTTTAADRSRDMQQESVGPANANHSSGADDPSYQASHFDKAADLWNQHKHAAGTLAEEVPRAARKDAAKPLKADLFPIGTESHDRPAEADQATFVGRSLEPSSSPSKKRHAKKSPQATLPIPGRISTDNDGNTIIIGSFDTRPPIERPTPPTAPLPASATFENPIFRGGGHGPGISAYASPVRPFFAGQPVEPINQRHKFGDGPSPRDGSRRRYPPGHVVEHDPLRSGKTIRVPHSQSFRNEGYAPPGQYSEYRGAPRRPPVTMNQTGSYPVISSPLRSEISDPVGGSPSPIALTHGNIQALNSAGLPSRPREARRREAARQAFENDLLSPTSGDHVGYPSFARPPGRDREADRTGGVFETPPEIRNAHFQTGRSDRVAPRAHDQRQDQSFGSSQQPLHLRGAGLAEDRKSLKKVPESANDIDYGHYEFAPDSASSTSESSHMISSQAMLGKDDTTNVNSTKIQSSKVAKPLNDGNVEQPPRLPTPPSSEYSLPSGRPWPFSAGIRMHQCSEIVFAPTPITSVQTRCHMNHQNIKISKESTYHVGCMNCSDMSTSNKVMCQACGLRICETCRLELEKTCDRSLVLMASKLGFAERSSASEM